MRRAREETETSGGSFDTAHHVFDELRRTGDTTSWDYLTDIFVHAARQQDMLEPGAREVLEMLDQNGASFGIMTYGGELWQRVKLEASGLKEVAYLITSSKAKGLMIAGWQQKNGQFALPLELTGKKMIIASHITLIDDKAASFEGLPLGADGIHILPPLGQEQLLSQQGARPASVQAVHGLLAALSLIMARLEEMS